MHQWSAVSWAMMAGVVMILTERSLSGSVLPRVRGWIGRVVAINLFQVAIAVVSGLTWNRWLQGASLFPAAKWPDWLAVGLTYFVSTLVFY